jgi:hypothetical protein
MYLHQFHISVQKLNINFQVQYISILNYGKIIK